MVSMWHTPAKARLVASRPRGSEFHCLLIIEYMVNRTPKRM